MVANIFTQPPSSPPSPPTIKKLPTNLHTVWNQFFLLKYTLRFWNTALISVDYVNIIESDIVQTWRHM